MQNKMFRYYCYRVDRQTTEQSIWPAQCIYSLIKKLNQWNREGAGAYIYWTDEDLDEKDK